MREVEESFLNSPYTAHSTFYYENLFHLHTLLPGTFFYKRL